MTHKLHHPPYMHCAGMVKVAEETVKEHAREEIFPITRLDRKLTPEEWDKEMGKQRSKLPSHIDIVPTPNVGLRESKVPVQAVIAGYQFKYISVSIMSADKKCVVKQNASMSLTITHVPTGVKYQLLCDKPSSKGLYTFNCNQVIIMSTLMVITR